MLQHADLDIEERADAAVSLEALTDLVEWYQCGDESRPGMSPPLALGHDMRAKFGDEAFPLWRDLMFVYEPPLLADQLIPGDKRTACSVEEYEAALIDQWGCLERPRHWIDTLIIDAMSRAKSDGWEICAPEEVSASTEAILDDLARRSGAKRAALVSEDAAVDERSWERAEKCYRLDDAAYANWVAAGEPDGKARKFARWKARRERDHRAAAVRDTPLATGTPMPSPTLHIVPAAPPPPKLIHSSAEFVAGFEPPEFLIDGTIQRRYFYSMTAQTGVGKTSVAMRWMAHVVTGRPIGDAEVQQGSVLYFAGENPSDVLYRWLVLSRDMGIDPNTDRVNWIVGAKNLNSVAEQITAEVAAKNLNLAYVVIDTAAAYNPGDEENSNNQAGDYARQLRSLTTLPGGPCVVVLCHPTKSASDEALVPRGGGAFLAEVDGNMAVMRRDSILAVTPLGKFRGDMSWVQRYEIDVIKDHPKLKDARGRQMKSVLARPVAEGTAAVMERRSDADTASVLRAVCDRPGLTPTDYARALGWTYGPKNDANNVKVGRVLKRLLKEKLVVERLGTWRTTPAGDKELNAIDLARATAPPFPLPG